VTRQASVTISCTIAPTAVPPTTAPASQVAGVPRLPSAGSGPGSGQNPALLYGGMALVGLAGVLVARAVTPSRRRRRVTQ
jgi:hypothetical protein